MIQIGEDEWRRRLADRRRLIGEIRAMRHLLEKLMQALEYHRNSIAPERPLWQFAGISEKQYVWWAMNVATDPHLFNPEEN